MERVRALLWRPLLSPQWRDWRSGGRGGRWRRAIKPATDRFFWRKATRAVRSRGDPCLPLMLSPCPPPCRTAKRNLVGGKKPPPILLFDDILFSLFCPIGKRLLPIPTPSQVRTLEQTGHHMTHTSQEANGSFFSCWITRISCAAHRLISARCVIAFHLCPFSVYDCHVRTSCIFDRLFWYRTEVNTSGSMWPSRTANHFCLAQYLARCKSLSRLSILDWTEHVALKLLRNNGNRKTVINCIKNCRPDWISTSDMCAKIYTWLIIEF